MEMEPTASARKLTHLGDLLEPDFGDENEFYRKWLEWEQLLKESTPSLGTMIPNDIMIAIVTKRAPAALRTHLQLQSFEY